MDIKALKPSSAKLLLHLLVNGGLLVNLSALAASLEMDRKTITAARQELFDRRFVGENLDIDPSITAQLVSKYSPHFLRAEENFPTSKPSTAEIFPTEENLLTTVRNNSPVSEEISDSPRTRCAQADRIGHRTEQLEALAYAFSQRFPGKPEPSKESLKVLLRLTEDSAEAVDEAFELAAVRPIESPWSYVRAMLTRQKSEAPKPPAPAVDSDDLPPAPPEMLERMRKMDALMRRKGLILDEGE